MKRFFVVVQLRKVVYGAYPTLQGARRKWNKVDEYWDEGQ